MTVFNIFSKRQKLARGQMDIFSYDEIPQKLKVQIIHIMNDALGNAQDYLRNQGDIRETYKAIVEILCREMGTFVLPGGNQHSRNYYEELANFILGETDVENFLSAVELAFRVIDNMTRNHNYLYRSNYNKIADGAIEELNQRFKESNFGYQFSNDFIIRMDSEFLHEQAVKPALILLGEEEYSGAKQEFLSAYHHHLQSNEKEALTEALKALESTMKVICAERNWPHDPVRDTASKLIKSCIDNGLIPQFWESHFSALKTTLEAGVPTGRNRLGGHGQGVNITTVPTHLTAYVLHQTAAAIVFLIESEKALP